MRTALIAAIAGCAEPRLQRKARAFLQGLSNDELRYIAEFLGSCVLESLETSPFRHGLAGGSADREHKMILLHEYLRAYSAGSFSSLIQMLR